MSIEIYEVQSAALADGVYTCRKQCLLVTGWEAGHGDKFEDATIGDPPVPVSPVEVLNLLENETGEDYTRALATGDRIAAWPITDCSGSSVLVGRPITPDVRRAIVKEDAPAEQQITCNLIANDGETEIESGLGSGIEVYCKISPNSNLNEAQPRLASGDCLFVQNISGKWWYDTVFTGSEDCVCNTE